jgi:two-component system, OmpR family, response regulator
MGGLVPYDIFGLPHVDDFLHKKGNSIRMLFTNCCYIWIPQNYPLIYCVNKKMENQPHSVKRVLIIDDETDFCLLMKNYFIRKNYEVHIYHTLSEGMRNLEVIKPDIIFLDNNLPDGLGWEKTEYITQHFPNTRINLISAYQYDHTLANKLNTVRIWEKPISLTDLNQYLN